MLSATHNRAGEITYRHLNGFTYEFTITTCTKSSVIADREWLQLDWGDLPTGAPLDSIQREGFVTIDDIDSQINTYIGTHTYNGPGVYTITMLDPNRNQGVQNIPNSVDVPFCIRSELVISPVTGHNDSVVLLNQPKEEACLDKLWIHNPGAFDPDGDLLVYSLVECRGFECAVIPGYQFPDDSTDDLSDVFAIDSQTGDVTWDVPPQAGEYNIAILIEEFRQTDFGLVKVGSVIRDMQINVITCDNNPPVIQDLPDVCVLVDETVTMTVNASDPDGDSFSLSAVGGPLSEVDNLASFNTFSGEFIWTPRCEEVRYEPYQVHFKAIDNIFGVDLTDIETVLITVIAPPVEDPAAQAVGNLMQLSWTPHECLANFPASDWDEFNYKIYRRVGESGWEPGACETGVPPEAGYELVGTQNGLESSGYVDNLGDLGSGYYCYRIVTCWPDGSQSVASEEFCAEVQLDTPLMTNVSVDVTDVGTGQNTVRWYAPIEIDTDIFLPPYQYRLYHAPGFNQPETLVYESSLGTDLLFDDIEFIHSGIDTDSQGNSYHVEFYSNGELAATSLRATSIFLTLIPDDNQITLVMNHQTPWYNTSFEIYRQNDAGDFELIGTSEEATYTDTGLLNNVTYCYKVKSIGTYSADDIPDPLENWSQETCGKAFDLTPPCPPELSAEAFCEEEETILTWLNPETVCGSDDVVGYNLYYAETDTSAFELFANIDGTLDTTFIFNENQDLNTIAGCFYVTAIDSLLPGPTGNLVQNESEPSNVVCTDNCPEYELPNVFTPNNDGWNDFYVPFPYRFIESIDFQVFNRWGGLVFQTNDPEIGWDGLSMNTNQVVADGTYYYVVKIRAIRLSGIVETTSSGYLTLLDGKGQVSE